MKLVKNGSFITIEGSDGTGKTTQCKYLLEYLKKCGFDVVHTREPGGTPLGEKLRTLLLNDQMCPMSELLLFAASRAEHIQNVIKPAMAAGKVVLCDRFSDSTYAYQGAGRGFPREVLLLETLVHAGFEPDHTLFFHAPEAVCLERLRIRTEKLDRFDKEQLDFKHKVYEGYLYRYEQKKHRMSYINADNSEAVVYDKVRDWVNGYFIPSIEIIT